MRGGARWGQEQVESSESELEESEESEVSDEIMYCLDIVCLMRKEIVKRAGTEGYLITIAMSERVLISTFESKPKSHDRDNQSLLDIEFKYK